MASPSTSKSDLDNWRISATVYKDRVEELRYETDPARGIRRQQYTKVWQVDEFLGRGGFGEVRLQTSSSNSGGGKEAAESRAVKRIPLAGRGWSDRECEKELKALLEFSKPKFKEAAVFVEFFGWFKDGSDIFLAMEYVPLGDLEKNVLACSGKVPEPEARDIAEQVLSALQIMHAESFAHRDLKPQNILVVRGPPTWWIKVADFGLSKRLTDSTVYQTVGGSRDYMAPEMLETNSNGEYTKAVDIWSVGCIVYRIAAGHPPFSFRSLGPYCVDRTLFPLDPLINSKMGSLGCMFIQELLAANPNERPSASKSLSRAWINSPDFKARARHSSQNMSCPDWPAGPIMDSHFPDITFDTATHAGLKSYSLPLSSRCVPPNHDISAPSSPIPDVAATFISNTVPLPPGPEHSRVRSDGLTSYPARPQSPPTMLSHIPSSWDPVRKIFRGHHPSRPRPAQLGVSRPNEVKPASPEIDGPKVLNHNGEVFSASFSPDGKILASASLDRRFRLWDVQKAVIIREVELRIGKRSSISAWRAAAIAFSGNEVMFAMAICLNVGLPASVRIFDTITGERKVMLHPQSNIIHLAYTPDCLRLVFVHIDHSVSLYDLASDTLLQKFEANIGCIPIIHFHESTIKVAQEPCKYKARYWTLANKLYLSAIVTVGGTIRVWDHMSGEDIAHLTDYSGEIRCLTFSPDARLLFSASVDGAIRFWHIDTGSCRIFGSHILPATWVGFSPDGQMLASASTDGTVKLWDLAFLIKNSV